MKNWDDVASKIKTTMEFVTPEMARKYLGSNHTYNRKKYRNEIEKMARSITAGNWVPTHQGIAFSGETLIDGQHRLEAIILAGTGAYLQVSRGVCEEAMLIVDSGRTRSASDHMHITGRTWITSEIISIIRLWIRIIDKTQKLSELELIEIAEFYRVHFEFATSLRIRGARAVGQVSILGAFAIAHYRGEDPDQLELMAESLKEGLTPQPHYASIVRLRDYILSTPSGRGSDIQIRLYRVTQRFIKAFIQKKILSSVRPPEDDYYPLPAQEIKALIGMMR